MAGSAIRGVAVGLLVSALMATGVAAADDVQATRVVGWVSDGHCGAKHMKPGGAACVRKCIAGAEHLNPEWKPGGMVFVTDDKQLWRVDNPDALWGHESEQVEVMASVNDEKKSLKVVKIVRVRQR